MSLGAKVLALVVVGVLFPGCGASDPGGPVELEVTTQDWTGWQREQPLPSTRTLTVEEGDTFTVQALGDEVTVTVVGIDDDEVELETSRDLAPRSEDGGADLNDLTDSFEFDRGGSVQFSTPTLDAGTTVTFAEV